LELNSYILQITGAAENAVPLHADVVSLKTKVQDSSLHLQHTRHQFSLDGAGTYGLDVVSANYNCDYFEYLCIPASGIMLYHKRMSSADRSHIRRQAVETGCKNEPC
jgi:hypothetical protein